MMRRLSNNQIIIGTVVVLVVVGILFTSFPRGTTEKSQQTHLKLETNCPESKVCPVCQEAPKCPVCNEAGCPVCKEPPKCPDNVSHMELRLQKQISGQLTQRLALYNKLSSIEEKCSGIFNQFPSPTAPDFDPLGSGAAGKAQIMLDYAKKYNIKYFVETGTFMGGTLAQMIPHFQKSYSIELAESYYQRALETFRGDIDAGRCKLFKGDSASQLKEIVKELPGPAFFWLDGHWSGGDTAMGGMDTPIFDEILTVFTNFKYSKDSVIFIDDARLFRGLSQDVSQLKTQLYPTVREILEFLCVYSPYGPAEVSNIAFTLQKDMMIISKKL